MTNAVFDALVSRARARASDPVVTYVDTAKQRTELSAVTLLNAVAKSANLLREEYDVEVGTPISLTIPWHWQRAPWLIACLTLGADISFTTGAPCEIGSLESLRGSSARDQLAVSLHPFGLPLGDLEEPLVDAAAAARLQPDAFFEEEVDNRQWLQAVADRGATLVLGDRILAVGDCGWEIVLGPLTCPASLVMVEAGADADQIGFDEGTTVTW